MMVLVTGASGSGKSEYAEGVAVKLAGKGNLYYLATMRVYGEEGARRVERHRKLRAGKGFQTVECPVNVDEAFALATCEAKESGLYAVEGTIAGGVEMYAYNWMFLPMPDYPDQYAMGDIIENGDNIFDFKLFLKLFDL